MLRPPQGSVGGHDVMLAAVSPLPSSTGMPARSSSTLATPADGGLDNSC